MNMSLSKLWEIVKDREAWFMGSETVGYDLVTGQQQQWCYIKYKVDTLTIWSLCCTQQMLPITVFPSKIWKSCN